MYVVELAGGPVFHLEFLPDGRRLQAGYAAPAAGGAQFDIVALPDGGRLPIPTPPLPSRVPPHNWSWCSPHWGAEVAVHPAGDWGWLAWGGRLTAFRTVDGRTLPPPTDRPADQVVMSADGRRALVVGGDPPALTAFDLSPDGGGSPVRGWAPRFVRLAGFLPDGDRYVTVGDVVRVSDFATGDPLMAVPYPPRLPRRPLLSPDGRHLVMYGTTSMHLLDLATGGPFRHAGCGRAGADVSFAFHPAGRSLAVAFGGTALLKVYDLGTFRPARKYDWGAGDLWSVAFSPDGLLGAAGTADGRVVVWDAEP